EGGLKYGIFCFLTTAALGLLLATGIGAILYLTLFGIYPLVKSIAERQRSQILGWVIKLLVFLLALSYYIFVWVELLLGVMPLIDQAWPVIYAAGVAAFVVYDIGLSKLIGFYLARIYKNRGGDGL
ncbi:MAG: hypothetical protein FWD84_05655, partial [Oscillospiraceae bacterium]|nr:hypothetical protein [Oscillospiraceae bacterium]